MLNKFKNNKIVSTVAPVELPVPNIEQITSELNIETLAHDQARRELPATSAITPDSNELNVEIHFKTQITQASVRVEESINQIKSAITSISLQSQHAKIKNYCESFSNKINSLFSSVRSEHDELLSNYHAALEDLESFKVKNRLRREAVYPESHFLSFALLLSFVLIESILNGYFFAGGNDLGLLGGVLQATIISIINIVMGFLLGYLLLPQLNHIGKVRQYFGFLSSLLLALTSVVFNLLVAHYRSALIDQPDNAGSIAVETFKDNIFYIQELDSWMLFALGLLFFVAAAWKAFKFDDPYPGFGKLARRKDSVRAEMQEFYENAKDEFEELFENSTDELEDFAKEARHNLNRLNSYYSTLAHQRNIIEQYVDLTKAAYSAVIKKYRDENCQRRKTPPPDYFAKPIVITLRDVLPSSEVRDNREENETALKLITNDLPTIKLEMSRVYVDILERFNGLKSL